MPAIDPMPAGRVRAPLDPGFRPAALALRSFEDAASGAGALVVSTAAGWPELVIGLEQSDGQMSVHTTHLAPVGAPQARANAVHVERLVKFLLWARGGFRIYLFGGGAQGVDLLAEALRRRFAGTRAGRFDSDLVGTQIFGRPLEVVVASSRPVACARTRLLGRHLDGNRIGFDLGGSDRKVAAVVDGQVVFSDETVWDPCRQPDPDYHKAGILNSLRKAAAHLPKIDAIGGSAAGVYVEGRPRVSSLFRAVSPALFRARIEPMFEEIAAEMGGGPFTVVNDGEVTALAGSMWLGEGAVLGLALGTSTAAGYVTPAGHITSWLNELAFVPIDYRSDAPVDEWSGEPGCAVQYLSQQAVGRLLAPAGISLPAGLSLPEKLVEVQNLMRAGDARAERIYRTIGVYLGYAVAQFAAFYDFRHVLVLGRVTSGPGGDVMLAAARDVLAVDFPALAREVRFHVPDETMKRHGQAVAAASLPAR